MLDELVNTIETLKARINEHRTALQASEAQTRLSLIDPLLRALGWDTADPALVRPEFTLSGGRADYALLGEAEKPVAIMEAKRLNEALGTMDRRMQMLTYANFSNVAYAGLTDGDQWVLYRVFDQKPLEDRLVLDLSIVNLPAHESALKLLLLWRPNLASGQPIEASEPIVGTEAPAPETSAPGQSAEQNLPDAPEPGWISLREVKTETSADRRRPSAIRFPNGVEKQVTIWLDFLVGVAEWLIRDGALTPGRAPIADATYPSVYILNSQPRHADDREFSRLRELSNGLFLYTWGDARVYVDRGIALLETCGKDPDSVHAKVG